MSYSLEEKVKEFAILSRVGIILLQFIVNTLIPDHDAKVFQKPLDTNVTKSDMDALVESLFGGLTRWDSQYFLHIAQYGYTYENTLAFFPLFPLIIRHLCYFVSFLVEGVSFFLPIKNVISFHSCLIIASVLFNNLIFIKTAMILYKLSLLVLKSEKLAYISAIMFCINPASVFFSAAYSESLYCFLIFYGLLLIEEKNSFVNYIVIGMTGAVRSNGIINLGFIAYKYIKLKSTTKTPFLYNIIFNFGIFLALLPFLTHQFYCYSKFCLPNKVQLPEFIYDYGRSNNFVFPGSKPPWCNEFIPFAYTYVQKHYWNVGFLKYYEIKQIPNFLLATPMIYIIGRGTFNFVKQHKFVVLYLGFVDGNPGNELPVSAFAYVVHGFALTIFAILMIHIQVTTRLLASSSPLPYWFAARILSESLNNPLEVEVLQKLQKKTDDCYNESSGNKRNRWRNFLFTETFSGYSFFIKWYFLLYYFVGTVMFSNFLPWT